MAPVCGQPMNLLGFIIEHIDGFYTNITYRFFCNHQIALTADNREFVIWDTQTGKALAYWLAPADIIDIQLDALGNFAVLALKNNRAIIFNVKTGGIIAQYSHTHHLFTAAISAKGRLAISGGFDNAISIWQVDNQKLLHKIQLPNYPRMINLHDQLGLVFVHPARHNAAIYSINNGEMLHTLSIKNQFISFAKILDEQHVILGNNKNQVALYNYKTDKLIKRWQMQQKNTRSKSNYILSVQAIDEHFFAVSTDGYAYLLK